MKKIMRLYYLLLTQLSYRPLSLKMGLKVIIRKPIIITPKYLKFGTGIFVRDFARLEGISQYLDKKFNPIIEVENDVMIEQNLHLTCAEHVFIGRNSAIGANVTITDIYHLHDDISLNLQQQPIKVSAVVIGENCNIFNNSVILPGTVLGKSCIVAANSVVAGKTYEAFSILAGTPAKTVKRYSFDKKEWLKTNENGEFIN